jgi:hypothetical protein
MSRLVKCYGLDQIKAKIQKGYLPIAFSPDSEGEPNAGEDSPEARDK